MAALATCTPAGCIDWGALYACGNGRLDQGEECDDGNADDSDACTTHCRLATCGDGFTWTHVEDCDFGPDNKAKGCNDCIRCPLADPNLFRADGHCYKLSTEEASFDDARRTCAEDLGGYLVTLTSQAEADNICRELLAEAQMAPLWLGAFIPESRGVLEWINGDRWGSWEATWDPARPTGPSCAVQRSRSSEPCGAAGSYDWVWSPADCSGVRDGQRGYRYVCEREPAYVRTTPHHAYRAIHAPLPWEQARELCRSMHGYLLRVDDDLEQDEIRYRFPTFQWWVDARREALGTFATSDGKDLPYTNFGADPLAEAEVAECAFMTAGGAAHGNRFGLWKSKSCTQPSKFICELE